MLWIIFACFISSALASPKLRERRQTASTCTDCVSQYDNTMNGDECMRGSTLFSCMAMQPPDYRCRAEPMFITRRDEIRDQIMMKGCAMNDVCTCEMNFWLSGDVEQCRVVLEMMACLDKATATYGCDGTTHKNSIKMQARDQMNAYCPSQIECEDQYNANSGTCTSVETYLTCLTTSREYWDLNNYIQPVVDMAIADNMCPLSTQTTCQKAYLDSRMSSSRCMALQTYRDCLEHADAVTTDLYSKNTLIAHSEFLFEDMACGHEMCEQCWNDYASAMSTDECMKGQMLFTCLSAQDFPCHLDMARKEMLKMNMESQMCETTIGGVCTCEQQYWLSEKDWIPGTISQCGKKVDFVACLDDKQDTEMACDPSSTKAALMVTAMESVQQQCDSTSICKMMFDNDMMNSDGMECSSVAIYLNCLVTSKDVTTFSDYDQAKVESVTGCSYETITICHKSFMESMIASSDTASRCTNTAAYITCLMSVPDPKTTALDFYRDTFVNHAKYMERQLGCGMATSPPVTTVPTTSCSVSLCGDISAIALEMAATGVSCTSLPWHVLTCLEEMAPNCPEVDVQAKAIRTGFEMICAGTVTPTVPTGGSGILPSLSDHDRTILEAYLQDLKQEAVEMKHEADEVVEAIKDVQMIVHN